MADQQDSTSSASEKSSPEGVQLTNIWKPLFVSAESAQPPRTERCSVCNDLLSLEYYRVNNKMTCKSCSATSSKGQPNDHATFTRGLAMGIAASLTGMALYATFTIITGRYMSLISLGVGYLVAKAIKKGTNGLGGSRYRLAAVLLTYAAISTAAIPISISNSMRPSTPNWPTTDAQGTSFSRATTDTLGIDWRSGLQTDPLSFVLQLLLLGLASPFLKLQHDPIRGVIGLVILSAGLRIAWRLSAKDQVIVDGPHTFTS